jgi:hypothetical protein
MTGVPRFTWLWQVACARRVCPARRGALLLELVIALAIVVAVGMALLSMLGGAQRSLSRSVMLSQAADLAASSIAKLEAGIATIDDLDGPVTPEVEMTDPLADVPPEASDWVVEIETDRSGIAGLTVLEVTARYTPDESISRTMRKLVRLASDLEDEALEESELQELIDRANRGAGARGGPAR